ncbi:hypothetical protein [Lentilactobacillus hilgardii]|uniref:Uncharacterized protein n=1 Tax=Lentilactobacillus hilgardii (strain ATCC 8290 / DSM 20176 / CCUG 30140 / JCM 1155 / KCTC 3500 / NBRC 15886 / NCIMB 8040 / NRRL B-1843 / 9) TaxID=1423757 RepID=C0XG32_LENH9|nr:hypothetical protein [Lentilactobacillus hilgardii]EEI25669.1 hypothetical protein HMPREF0519_0193 [Lentilactobacillus hilgardii DSM 20176 = ATCC 8290]KRK53524.1 hypothetical protein FD42_GL002080 [Lentilactobacillus hilgardii DSM 20176 = ATCC 8290]QEU38905.1 hypothetical protein LH500_08395 [Lentilactobacillus hilgardii]TDG86522.1 hypothetical protein C5L34_002353 [Lentilactobacillus hilgardii]
MSNFMLNGISGNIKGGMLDQKLLFENDWQHLVIVNKELDFEGELNQAEEAIKPVLQSSDIFYKLNEDGSIILNGYVCLNFPKGLYNNGNAVDIHLYNVPDEWPKNASYQSSSTIVTGNIQTISNGPNGETHIYWSQPMVSNPPDYSFNAKADLCGFAVVNGILMFQPGHMYLTDGASDKAQIVFGGLADLVLK